MACRAPCHLAIANIRLVIGKYLESTEGFWVTGIKFFVELLNKQGSESIMALTISLIWMFLVMRHRQSKRVAGLTRRFGPKLAKEPLNFARIAKDKFDGVISDVVRVPSHMPIAHCAASYGHLALLHSVIDYPPSKNSPPLVRKQGLFGQCFAPKTKKFLDFTRRNFFIGRFPGISSGNLLAFDGFFFNWKQSHFRLLLVFIHHRQLIPFIHEKQYQRFSK